MNVCTRVACCILLWGTGLLAQVQVGVVLPFENQTRDPKLDWIGESFVEVLSSELGSGRLMMIDRRERTTAFDSLGIPNTSILSSATIYKVAEVLDADKLVLGRYDFQDGVFSAAGQVLDMKGPSLSQRFTESGPLASLLELQSGLAWQIQRFLRPDFPFSRQEYLAERTRPRLDAFENYLRGLSSNEKAPQVRYFREAQRLDPRFTKPAFELGMIYFKDRDYRTSALWLSKLRRADPDYLEANYFLGLAYLYLEQYERSAAAFRVVEQELPLNEVYNNLGIALMRLNRPGAIPYFEKAVQSDPADPDFQFNLGYAHWKRGNWVEASAHLRSALERDEQPGWRAIYAQCLQKAGQKEESERQGKLLPARIPTAAEMAKLEKLERPKDHYDGTSFRQLHRLILLQEELKHSKLSLPDHVELHFQRAQQFLQGGSERQAVEELQQVIDYDPEDARAYRELARVHLKAGQLEEALKDATRSLQWEKTPEGYLLLARIYLQQGKLEEAQAQLNATLGLDPSNTAAAMLREELNSRSASRQ